MIEEIFPILLIIASVYLVVGVGVAILFFTHWIDRFGATVADGSRGFRVLITPGVIALWPVILMRVRRRAPVDPCDGAERLRRAHRLAVILLAAFGILVFTTALVWRAPASGDLPAAEIPVP